jgi:methyl-accepting chemotaxis protein
MQEKIQTYRTKGFGLQIKLTFFISLLIIFIITIRTILIDLAIRIEGINASVVTYGSMVVGLIIGSLVSYIVIQINVTRPLKAVEEHIIELAQGNFSIEVPQTIRRKKDEFRTIAKAFNHMQTAVAEIITIVSQQADEVGFSSTSLVKTSDDMAVSSQDLSTTMQQVAEGAVNQSQYLQNIIESLDVLNQSIESTHLELNRVNDEVANTEKTAQTGSKELEMMVSHVNEVQSSFNQVINMIEHLSSSIAEISGITNIISGISEQTNLLALNAAIEAARAGEQGKGFAVVAEEVRKLAEESKRSTDNIISLIQSVNNNSEKVISTSKLVDDAISNQVESISSTEKTFDHILTSVKSMLPMIQSVNQSMDSIEDAQNIVAEKATSANNITSDNSAATEEAAASSEELSASSQEVSSTAQMLESIVNDLKVAVQKFNV